MTTRFRPKKEDTTSTTKRDISKKFDVVDLRCIMTERTCTLPADVVNLYQNVVHVTPMKIIRRRDY